VHAQENADTDTAGGTVTMFQWVASLVEVSWVCFPHLGGITERLAACVDAFVSVGVPLWESMKTRREVITSERVRAVFAHFDSDLSAIFSCYKKANQEAGIADAATLETVDITELVFMMKEGNLLDNSLTQHKLEMIFEEVNAIGEEEGVDDDEVELVFEEFLPALALICDAKVPPSARGDDPFELTLNAWLQSQFLPIYRRLLKEKEKGLAKRTI
jgi:hypothetical protein